MPFAESNGAEIFYESYGDGEAVVMIPGLASDHRHWLRAMQMLEGYHTISVDNRGCGQTRYKDAVSIDQMADDVLAVMDAEGIEKAHVIGWSMGSHIGLSLAARHPERVRTLCLVSSYIRRPARASFILGSLGMLYAQGKADQLTIAAVFNTLIHSEGWFAKAISSGKSAKNAEMPDPKSFMDQLLATQGYDPAPHAKMLTIPVMSVHGTEDIMTEPSFGDELADVIKDCVRIRAEGEGHHVSLSKYLEEYVEFIRSH